MHDSHSKGSPLDSSSGSTEATSDTSARSDQGAVSGIPTPPASVWRRFMGMVYEALLLFGPLLLLGFLYSVVVDFSDRADPASLAIKRLGLQLLLGGALLAYFVWGWTKNRCTLPMQTLGLRVQTLDGAPASTRQAVIRGLIAVPSVLTGLGILWAIIDRDSQTLHDRLSGTRLVYIPVKRML